MAFTRIHSATCYVNDKDKAVAWYVEKLGWEKRLDVAMGEDADMGADYRFITVAPVGSDAEVSLEYGQFMGKEPGGHNGISINVTDIDNLVKDLLAKGVELVGMEGESISEAQTMPWGDRAFWFKDLDGNVYYAIESVMQ